MSTTTKKNVQLAERNQVENAHIEMNENMIKKTPQTKQNAQTENINFVLICYFYTSRMVHQSATHVFHSDSI